MGGGRLAVSQLIAEVDDGGSLSIFSTLIVLEFCIITSINVFLMIFFWFYAL